MQAVKEAVQAVKEAVSGSNTSSSTTGASQTSSQPSASELATQVKDKLNLTGSSTSQEQDAIEGRHALQKMNEMASSGGSTTNVEDEVKDVTKDADKQAVSQHDKLVSEIEKNVPQVPPAAEGSADKSASTQEQSVPRVQDEIRDAAPEADVSAVQAHTLLVSEIEKVVDKDASKPVHEVVDKVSVEEPAELKDVKG
ncbi:hypothetical protein ACM66B_002015 [Microbotryomycetes sp. NB124-2]